MSGSVIVMCRHAGLMGSVTSRFVSMIVYKCAERNHGGTMLAKPEAALLMGNARALMVAVQMPYSLMQEGRLPLLHVCVQRYSEYSS